MLTFEFSGAEGRMLVSSTLTSGMVGKQVKFCFSPEWDGLRKTAVFTAGEVTRDVPDVWDEAVIPARVLEKPLEQLYVGIYGTNEAGDLVIPTVWVPGPVVKPGADPSGDPSTAPELPVWDRLMAMMGFLGDLETEARNNLVAAINEAARANRELQPDWNQANTKHADYIKNRTHWVSDGREFLRWDGIREGKRVLYLRGQDRWYCRISDRTPESWELLGGTVLFLSGGTVEQERISANGFVQGENAFLGASGSVLVVTGADFTLGEDVQTGAEPGFYVWFDHRIASSFVSGVSWGNLRILRLDDRFIPLTVPRKGEVGFLTGSNPAQLLMTLLQNATFKTDQTANLTALEQALGVDASVPGGISLTELTVSYSGGDVPAGTPLSALTGLFVLASYSDGSAEPVTNYTLSGSIEVGSNTITVTYQGKTASFTVTGTGMRQEGTAPVGWSVTLNLTGCTADRDNSYVTDGFPLAVGLTADAGCTLNGAKVTVTMGGVDISSYSYAGGLITIGAVTGDVEITAQAVAL